MQTSYRHHLSLAEKAYTFLKHSPLHSHLLESLSSHFTSEAASHLLLQVQTSRPLTLRFLSWAHHHPSFFTLHPKTLAIHILTKFHLFKSAQRLVEELITDENPSCFSVFDSIKSTYTLCNSASSVIDLLIKSYCKLNCPQKALDVLHLAKSHGFMPGVLSYNSIFDVMFRLRVPISCAQELYSEMVRDGVTFNVYSYNILIRGHLSGGEFGQALEFFVEMERKGCLPNMATYNTVIDAYSKAGKIDEAFKLLLFKLYHEHPVPDEITYETLIGHCGSAEFKSRVALMKGFCMKGLMEEASRVLDSIIKKGWALNDSVYNVMIHGYSKGGNVRMALKLYKEMVAAGFVPNTICVIALVKELSNEGMSEEFSLVLQNVLRECALTEAEPAKVLVEVNHKEGNIEAVLDVLNEMAKDGLLPNSEKTAISR
ncbi:hypothetical protein H6P81_010815 [Aristolochia fimbriata]|uniref:Pentatricopeptide repeat-containing protein n=1 Tax=Aristolochia fimbriata TaxID=158543 RepID=A0AAV7ERX8_ARIFI|nr:hypothetical protein H6P81_010815 [Aristolochia fimbriata]